MQNARTMLTTFRFLGFNGKLGTCVTPCFAIDDAFRPRREILSFSFVRGRYFDPETVGLDFEGMLADIESAPDGSVILLHGKP